MQHGESVGRIADGNFFCNGDEIVFAGEFDEIIFYFFGSEHAVRFQRIAAENSRPEDVFTVDYAVFSRFGKRAGQLFESCRLGEVIFKVIKRKFKTANAVIRAVRSVQGGEPRHRLFACSAKRKYIG